MKKSIWLMSMAIVVCALCRAEATAQGATPTATPTPAAEAATATQSNATARLMNGGRVPLGESALALGAADEVVLVARLRALPSAGTTDAPTRNARFVVENRSAIPYSYLSGRITFYDAEGVRCGEGLWTVNALAPGEAAETDAPGLRITAAPVTWRIVTVDAITRTGVSANTSAPTVPTTSANTASRLTININGTTMPVQPGNPVEVEIGGERVRIIVNEVKPER